MSRDVRRENADLDRWLEAERTGRWGPADEAFHVLFAETLAPLEPPPGLAEAVVSRALASAAAASRSPLALRVSIAAAVLLMGLPFAFFAGVGVFDLVVAWATRLVPAVFSWVSALAPAASLAGSLWSAAASVGNAVLAASATGTWPLVVLLNLLLAAGGLVGLRRLLAPSKECW